MIEQGFLIKEAPIDVEREILFSYNAGISRLLNYDAFWYAYSEDAGIDVCANQFLWAGYPLVNTNYRRLYIADEYLLNKYAAYVWHDHYIYPGLGMLLNNADNIVPANCFFDEDGIIKTMRNTQKGEFLRIDYGYKENYPPIPEEIREIRKVRLKLKENIKS